MDKFLPFLIAVLIHALPLTWFMLKKVDGQVGHEISSHPSGIDLSGFSTHYKTAASAKSKSTAKAPSVSTGQSAKTEQASSTDSSAGTLSGTSSGTSAGSGSNSLIISYVEPVYPPLARQKGIEGKVKLRAHYSAEGTITQVEVVDSSGNKMLDESAKKALSSWKFKKGESGSFEKTFQFKLND